MIARHCRQLLAEHRDLRERADHAYGRADRERAIRRLRAVKDELARERCPAY